MYSNRFVWLFCALLLAIAGQELRYFDDEDVLIEAYKSPYIPIDSNGAGIATNNTRLSLDVSIRNCKEEFYIAIVGSDQKTCSHTNECNHLVCYYNHSSLSLGDNAFYVTVMDSNRTKLLFQATGHFFYDGFGEKDVLNNFFSRMLALKAGLFEQALHVVTRRNLLIAGSAAAAGRVLYLAAGQFGTVRRTRYNYLQRQIHGADVGDLHNARYDHHRPTGPRFSGSKLAQSQKKGLIQRSYQSLAADHRKKASLKLQNFQTPVTTMAVVQQEDAKNRVLEQLTHTSTALPIEISAEDTSELDEKVEYSNASDVPISSNATNVENSLESISLSSATIVESIAYESIDSHIAFLYGLTIGTTAIQAYSDKELAGEETLPIAVYTVESADVTDKVSKLEDFPIEVSDTLVLESVASTIIDEAIPVDDRKFDEEFLRIDDQSAKEVLQPDFPTNFSVLAMIEIATTGAEESHMAAESTSNTEVIIASFNVSAESVLSSNITSETEIPMDNIQQDHVEVLPAEGNGTLITSSHVPDINKLALLTICEAFYSHIVFLYGVAVGSMAAQNVTAIEGTTVSIRYGSNFVNDPHYLVESEDQAATILLHNKSVVEASTDSSEVIDRKSSNISSMEDVELSSSRNCTTITTHDSHTTPIPLINIAYRLWLTRDRRRMEKKLYKLIGEEDVLRKIQKSEYEEYRKPVDEDILRFEDITKKKPLMPEQKPVAPWIEQRIDAALPDYGGKDLETLSEVCNAIRARVEQYQQLSFGTSHRAIYRYHWWMLSYHKFYLLLDCYVSVTILLNVLLLPDIIGGLPLLLLLLQRISEIVLLLVNFKAVP